jgi:hypothetical protein
VIGVSAGKVETTGRGKHLIVASVDTIWYPDTGSNGDGMFEWWTPVDTCVCALIIVFFVGLALLIRPTGEDDEKQ